MKRQRLFYALAFVIIVLLAVAGLAYGSGPAKASTKGVAQAGPLGTAFTYQGELKEGGEVVNDHCQMEFRLYNAPAEGSQVGGVITSTVAVSDGLFAVNLDFGSDAFAGEARWLGIQVQCSTDSSFVDLGRQELTAAPYAQYALGAPWNGLANVPPGFADGVDDVDDADADPANELELPPDCASGQLAEWDGSAWVCAEDDVD
ncbi:MAG: hypothetical protein JXA37_14730, partial [Chloroflexia bacterium]|nr:hypothetical protein [Chloroflexia bacterium]